MQADLPRQALQRFDLVQHCRMFWTCGVHGRRCMACHHTSLPVPLVGLLACIASIIARRSDCNRSTSINDIFVAAFRGTHVTHGYMLRKPAGASQFHCCLVPFAQVLAVQFVGGPMCRSPLGLAYRNEPARRGIRIITGHDAKCLVVMTGRSEERCSKQVGDPGPRLLFKPRLTEYQDPGCSRKLGAIGVPQIRPPLSLKLHPRSPEPWGDDSRHLPAVAGFGRISCLSKASMQGANAEAKWSTSLATSFSGSSLSTICTAVTFADSSKKLPRRPPASKACEAGTGNCGD